MEEQEKTMERRSTLLEAASSVVEGAGRGGLSCDEIVSQIVESGMWVPPVPMQSQNIAALLKKQITEEKKNESVLDLWQTKLDKPDKKGLVKPSGWQLRSVGPEPTTSARERNLALHLETVMEMSDTAFIGHISRLFMRLHIEDFVSVGRAKDGVREFAATLVVVRDVYHIPMRVFFVLDEGTLQTSTIESLRHRLATETQGLVVTRSVCPDEVRLEAIRAGKAAIGIIDGAEIVGLLVKTGVLESCDSHRVVTYAP